MDAAARLEPVHDRHAQIQEDDVGLELTGEPARLVAVVRAPRNLDLRLDAENGLERVQEKRSSSAMRTRTGKLNPSTA